MAMRSSTLRGRVLKFHTEALPPNTLLVGAMQGTEAISRLYRFDLELVSQKADVDSEAVLKSPAFLGIKQGTEIHGSDKRGIRTLRIHGVLSEFEQSEKTFDWVAYRAVLVPRLWRLTLDVRSRIFMDKTIPQIAEEVLKEAGFAAGKDYEFRLGGREYPKREYVVQFQEPTWNFLSRWFEYEGIFTFFLQGDEAEQWIVADQAGAHPSIVGEETLPYRPAKMKGANAAVPGSTLGNWFDEEVVHQLTCRHKVVPGQVVLKDVNWRAPADLKVDAPVAASGVGTRYEYGDHYKDPDEGKAFAKIRAEELRCRERLFVGQSDCRSFRAGSTYSLAEHYRADFNAKYLIAEVRHRAEQVLPLGGPANVAATYSNEFVAIPADRSFRPERVTPVPKIEGTINARVDAAGDGKYAELDDQGRYRVQLPFDLSGQGGGRASRPVRMAQPYVGAGHGMHFPLHKGTEVILTHILGNCDRPIIAAAVPNPTAESQVKGANQTQCLLKSGANNAVLFEDVEGEERLLVRAQKNQEIRVENDVMERVGHDRHLLVAHDQIEHVANDRHEQIGRHEVREVGGDRHLTLTGDESIDVGGQFSLTVQGHVAHAFLKDHCEETQGHYYLKADQLILEAASGITLRCGGSSVVIDAAGVTVAGPVVTLDGGQAKINSGAGSSPASGVARSALSPIAAKEVLEPGDLAVSAATLASEAAAKEEAPASEKTTWIAVELKDKNTGKPVPREMYEVLLPGGKKIRGRLDKEGKAMVKGIPSSGKAEISFPRVDPTDWNKS